MRWRHERPSERAFRGILIRVDPDQFDAALQAWQEAHGGGRDTALAIDGDQRSDGPLPDRPIRVQAGMNSEKSDSPFGFSPGLIVSR